MTRLLGVLSFSVTLLATTTASAHYLFLNIDPKLGPHGSANLYFEEGPRAGNGEYLDPFVQRGKLWIRSLDNPEPKELKLVEVNKVGKRWLTAELPAGKARVISSYGRWGVYRYGNTDVLLHYYARRFDVSSAEQLKSLARAEHLNLDIVPQVSGESVQAQVLWKGKPATDRTVYVRGAGLNEKLKTDANGKLTFKPSKGRTVTLRTHVVVKQPGKEGDKEYQEVRHWCTLVVNLPLK